MALFRRGRVWWMGFPYHGKQVRRSTEVTDKKLAEKIYHCGASSGLCSEPNNL